MNSKKNNLCWPDFLLCVLQGKVQELEYPTWAIIIFVSLIILAIMPVPVVFLLRYFNVIQESSSSLSSVSYKKGRIIKESPQPGEDDDTSLIRSKAPSEAPSPADIIYRKQSGGDGPEADALPNGNYGMGYLMVDISDVPESHL